MTENDKLLAVATSIRADGYGAPAGSFPERKTSGPKTPAGKRRAALNSLRHGIYADAVLIKGEDRDDYLRFARAIVAALDVQNALEMAFAERIVSALWRSRRARRYEQAHLNRFAEEAEFRRKALEDAAQAVADHERQSDAMFRLASCERMTSEDLDAAAKGLADVYLRAATSERNDLPDHFWDLFPEHGKASRKRVAEIAAGIRDVFKPLYPAETSYEFLCWIMEQVAHYRRELENARERAARVYAAAIPQTLLLVTEETAAHWICGAEVGRILEDAERRLDRQVSRALADLEAARRLRPTSA